MKKIFSLLGFVLLFSFSAFAQNISANCPTIEVIGGGVVREGEPMTFTVQITNKTNNLNLEYEWKVSTGTIRDGQGTPSITVDTSGLAEGLKVKAEVKVKGLRENCSDTASETGAILILCRLRTHFDEFGKVSRDEVRARIDAFLEMLGIALDEQGYIINYGTDAEIAQREKLITEHINSLKYDLNRITFLRGSGNLVEGASIYTRFWIFPKGKTPPTDY